MSNSVIYVVYISKWNEWENIDYTKIEKYHAICVRQIDMIVEMNDNGMTCLWKYIYIMNIVYEWKVWDFGVLRGRGMEGIFTYSFFSFLIIFGTTFSFGADHKIFF
jgi:hypothetical protein